MTREDWGVSHVVIDRLLDRADRVSDDADRRDEAFARAIWHVVAEPGDGDAGCLIQTVGAVRAARLLIDRADVAGVSSASKGVIGPKEAATALGRWRARLRVADVLRALEIAPTVGARLLIPGDTLWPERVDQLDVHAPPLLWARGAPESLAPDGVAIVGARAATGYGEHVAMEISAGLVSRDVAVVSGGAYGIDGMAHRAALASGGVTVAALAGGIDRLYPAGHEALLHRVIDQGLVVSEVPCGTAPTRWRFLQRNRLIAALSRATVVVEAGFRSGALNTARHAASLALPVGAVPGPITSASSSGCHRLLRDHEAVCVTSTADVMELAFGLDTVRDAASPTLDLEDGERPRDALGIRVLDALRPRRYEAIPALARAVGESAEVVRGALGILELEGIAVRDADDRWRRA